MGNDNLTRRRRPVRTAVGLASVLLGACAAPSARSAAVLSTAPITTAPSTTTLPPTTTPPTTRPRPTNTTAAPQTTTAATFDPKVFAAAPTPEGFVRITDRGGLVSVALPADFRPLTDAELVKVADVGVQAIGGRLTEDAEAVLGLAAGFVDDLGESVVVLPGPASATFQAVVRETLAAVRRLPVDNVVSDVAIIDDHAAYVIGYTLDVGIKVNGRQLLLNTGDRVVTVTISWGARFDEAIIDQIVSLVRIA